MKHPANQATKIRSEDFANHYAENWETQPKELMIDEDSDFIIQRKLVIKELKC
jgi:hypothetical protein